MIVTTAALEAIRTLETNAVVSPSASRQRTRSQGRIIGTRSRAVAHVNPPTGDGGGGGGGDPFSGEGDGNGRGAHLQGVGGGGPGDGNPPGGGGGDGAGSPLDGAGVPAGGGPPGGGGDGEGGGGPADGNPLPLQPIPETPWVVMLRRIGVSNPAIRFMIMDEAVDSSDELISLSNESVDRLFSRMDTRQIAYSTVVHNRYRLLHHMMKRLTFSGLPIVLENVNVELLRTESLIVQSEPPKGTKSKIPLPGKFKDEKDWISFQNALSNYLKSVRGMGMIPLIYVLRPSNNAMPMENSTDPAILNAPHDGPMFLQDNREVYCILDELTCKGPGETIVRKYRVSTNGRAAFLELHAHFSGGAYKTIKVKQANDVIKNIRYNGYNQNFSFETFRRMFADAYRDLEEANQGVAQQAQVLNFLDAITMPELQTAVTAVQSNDEYLLSFEKASSFIAGIAVRMSNRKGVNVPRSMSVVDTRSRSPDEWKKLSKDEKDKIIKARRDDPPTSQDTNRKIADVAKSDKKKSDVSYPKKGGKPKMTSSLEPKRKVTQVDVDSKGSTDEDDDEVSTDEGDDEVEEELYTPLAKKYAQPKRVRFKKALYRSINVLSLKEPGRAELDSHADNCIFTSEGRVLEESGDTFTVYGYDGRKGTERTIKKVAVAHDTDDGVTVILVFGQAFQDHKVMNTLINPNQLRDNGVVVHDTPTRYESTSSHALWAPLDDGTSFKIQLKSRGYVSYFNIRYPTDEELETCQHIVMTADTWDPESEEFEENERAAYERQQSSVSVNLRTYRPTPHRLHDLSVRWRLPIDRVKKTLEATTALAQRVHTEPKYGRYGHAFRQLGRKRLSSKFYTDTFFGHPTSQGNTCAQIFINDVRYIYVVPLAGKADAPVALQLFFDTVGLPEQVINDNSWEQTSRRWKEILREFGVQGRQIHPYSQWKNYAENGVKALKFRSLRIIEEKNVPIKLWDHLVEYVAALNNVTCHDLVRLGGRTPTEITLGYTPDISHLLDYGFYDYVWYNTKTGLFPEPKRIIGRWIGPAKQQSSDLSMKVLTSGGRIIVSATLQPVTKEELEQQGVKDQIQSYEASIQERNYKTSRNPAQDLLLDLPPGKAIASAMRTVSIKDEGNDIVILDHYHRENHWYFLVRFLDSGDESIITSSDLYSSYPQLLQQYSLFHKLEEICIGETTPMRSLGAVRKVKKTEKFGIDIPRSVKEALEFDKLNDDSLWEKAIEKEILNTKIAFEILPKGKRPHPGYAKIRCHMVFDVKMDMTRKARFVAGGHMVDAPSELTFATVATRDSVRIILMLASLNNLKIMACDIQNAYLNALPREKVYFQAGPEFGKDEGKNVLIVRALYGLKTSGAAFRSKLAEDIRRMGYKPTMGDPDVYIKGRMKSDGFKYFEYLVVYVDDIICVSEHPEEFMKALSELYKLKDGWHEPKTYLGMNLSLTDKGWLISVDKYIGNVLATMSDKAFKRDMSIPKNCKSPLPSGYQPEIDDTDLVLDDDINWYQGMVGTLRWLVEIARPDIGYATSVLSTYLCCPRKGHIKAALHVLGYISCTRHYSLLLNPDSPDLRAYVPVDITRWKDYYTDVNNLIEGDPIVHPKSSGNPVVISVFVDADHAGDLANRRSQTGLIIFINSSAILWLSKKQTTVETSSYGSELVALKMATELIEGLMYKLTSFGVPVMKPAYLFCDNQSVVYSASTPESSLKKKHNSVAYHRVREAAARGLVAVYKISSEENLADLLTKALSGRRTAFLAGIILFILMIK